MVSKPFAVLSALLLALTLAGCDSAEERAENHYQRGMELLAEGDAERAMIEFRNVFRLNGDHSRARLEYARLLEERGNLREAYSQYLRLVEQDPKNLDGRVRLGELGLTTNRMEDAATHIAAAYAMAPEDPAVRALKATVDYANGERAAAVEMARGVIAEDPARVDAHMIVIADAVNAGKTDKALDLLEAALAVSPKDQGLNLVKLSTIEKAGDPAAVGAQLRHMVELYPENDGFAQALIRWYISQGDLEGAEAELRRLAARAPADNPAPALDIVQFLLETRGPGAARAELDRLVAEGGNPVPFQRARAVLDYSTGDTEAGIAGLRQLIEATEASDDRRDTQIVLARMLAEAGQAEESAALVEAVLAEDADHVEALKLRARRQIAADKPELAIQDMRAALEAAPRDAEALTIMAEGHEREGARELAGERLALAVEAANRAPAESLRYARFLLQDDRLGPAESVVVDALRLAPQNRDLLGLLGQIHLERRDWTRATQIAGILRQQDDPAATRIADAIEATALRGQNRLDETADLLRGMADENSQDIAAIASLVRTYVETGDIMTAESYIGEKLATNPQSVPLRMIRAGLYASAGDVEATEATYRNVIADAPEYPRVYHALYTFLNSEGRSEEAEAVLDAGIEATDDGTLLFDKAALLEQQGDFDGAIAIYETLYERDSASQLIANNLASLLTTQRDDPESLERAFTIARRLRSSDIPYYQDTYGWILSRRGDHIQALSYLEPAAENLPQNALVQFHLGKVYAALERRDAAREALERAIAASEAGSPLPQDDEARALMDSLAAIPATTPQEGDAPLSGE